jgi:hypothetical protein
MTEKERLYNRKRSVVNAMCATATANGKPSNWYDMERVADRLHRLETTLSRLAGDESNHPTYDATKQERLERLAESIITNAVGCKAYTQRDPRGFAIRMYLIDEDGRKFYNSWDGETTGLNW